MSLRAGVLVTYVSQLYVAVIGLAVTPLYLHALGAEAYALVGFFAMLLAWFQLLDVGLSPAVIRETARFRGGAIDAATLRGIVRAVELLFLAVAVAIALATALLAEPVSRHWLRPEQLDAGMVADAIWLMAGSIGLRFAAILYRAIATGFEQLAWLGGFNAVIATLRALAVLPAMVWWGATPGVFFAVQLAVSAVELGWLVTRGYRSLPTVARPTGLSLAPLRGIARFSAAVAFTGALSVALTQSDRLLLSGLLTLGEYAYFNLAVLAASAVLLAGSPLTSALLPRLSALQPGGTSPELRRVYLLGASAMAVATIPPAAVLAVHSGAVLMAWTGQEEAARASATTLALYALGNAVVSQLGLPYALQFAFGRLRMHVIGNALLVMTLIPGQVALTMRYGAAGAAAFWLAINLLFAMAWIPWAMRPLAPTLLRPWYLTWGRAAVVSLGVCLLATPLVATAAGHGRVWLGAALVVTALLTTLVALLADPELRRLVGRYVAEHGARKGSSS